MKQKSAAIIVQNEKSDFNDRPVATSVSRPTDSACVVTSALLLYCNLEFLLFSS